MAAVEWSMVGWGVVWVGVGVYGRLRERTYLRRGVDAVRYRLYRVWMPVVLGIPGLGHLPRALDASLPVVVVCQGLSFAPVVLVVVAGRVLGRKPASDGSTAHADAGAQR